MLGMAGIGLPPPKVQLISCLPASPQFNSEISQPLSAGQGFLQTVGGVPCRRERQSASVPDVHEQQKLQFAFSAAWRTSA